MRFRSFWLMNNDVKSRATKRSSPLHKIWRLQYMEKILLSLKELCEYTGWGETKVREILKRENSTFTIRLGNRLYADKSLFDEYINKCAKYQIRI